MPSRIHSVLALYGSNRAVEQLPPERGAVTPELLGEGAYQGGTQQSGGARGAGQEWGTWGGGVRGSIAT